jgi:hypothetical protein
MKFLDKIALNRLIAIITSFILGLAKILKTKEKEIEPPILKPRRPIIEKIRKIFDHE